MQHPPASVQLQPRSLHSPSALIAAALGLGKAAWLPSHSPREDWPAHKSSQRCWANVRLVKVTALPGITCLGSFREWAVLISR